MRIAYRTGSSTPAKTPQDHRTRLRLEPMEDRLLMSVKQIAVGADYQGNQAVYATGLDDKVYAVNGSAYTLVNSTPVLGLKASPVLINNAAHIFVRGADEKVYITTSTAPNSWNAYSLVNSDTVKAISYGRGYNGTHMIFVIKPDNKVYYTSINQTPYAPYAKLNDETVVSFTSKVAGSWSRVAVTKTDNQVYEAVSTAYGNWPSTYTLIATGTASQLSWGATAWPGYATDLFARLGTGSTGTLCSVGSGVINPIVPSPDVKSIAADPITRLYNGWDIVYIFVVGLDSKVYRTSSSAPGQWAYYSLFADGPP